MPRSFIPGRYATAGSLAYHNEWGETGKTPNAYYTRITALSDLPVKGLGEVWIDGNQCGIDWNNPHPDFGLPVIGYETTTTISAGVISIEGANEVLRLITPRLRR
ncbi:hypothetical protein [Candidatus Halocynthiibacter alkanivorans]|uniref:hypothetical protein n=1 Tax=Candidatus Halocynthiibacter alkanivorans TaxID=2267619 RepID=UPI000DF47ECE|nr:hypothetical protein [Candidatus Halocynthiibacter alkanivorans]